MSTTFTKKQQKALDYRSKQKVKKSGRGEIEQADVPEQDLEQDEVVDAVVVGEGSKKKRKREAESERVGKEGAKAKGKTRSAWDEEDAEGDEGKKSKKEIKQRFILFVGQLISHKRRAC